MWWYVKNQDAYNFFWEATSLFHLFFLSVLRPKLSKKKKPVLGQIICYTHNNVNNLVSAKVHKQKVLRPY